MAPRHRLEIRAESPSRRVADRPGCRGMTEGSALTMSTCLSRIQAVSTSRSRTRHAVQSVAAAEGAKAAVYVFVLGALRPIKSRARRWLVQYQHGRVIDGRSPGV